MGDAFAWAVLGFDKKVLHSLGHNSRVAISPEIEQGSIGVTAIAGHLANEGWGFPLIHDVTDCLRIGDVTFVRAADPSLLLQTVEVKTRLTSEQATNDGGTTYQYEVLLLSQIPLGYADRDPEPGALPNAEVQPVPGARRVDRPRQPDRRDRQVHRLTKAVMRQSAAEGTVVDIPGEAPLLSMRFDSAADSHWKTLRRLIRTARKEGYASECVDGALLYIALFAPDGITEEHIKNERMPRDLVESGILFAEDKRRNAIIISQIPAREGTEAQRFLPFYLYPIPRYALSDFIRGRLCVIVMFNPGRIIAALEADGFEVTTTSDRLDLTGDSLLVSARITDDTGNSCLVEMHGLSFYMSEIVEEFKGVHYVVEAARAMREAVRSAVIEKKRPEGQPDQEP